MPPFASPLRLILSLVIGCMLASSAAAQLPDPLRLDSGLITGTAEGAVQVYRGIPYAAAPVGRNRWRNPQPVTTWSGIRDATRFGPRCVQAGFEPGSSQPLTSEDCLYVNVWTPAGSDTDLLPVLVWIHGGGFFTGSGSSDLYDGAALAAKGAVVVTLNYRLGSFGFFAHPGLSAESPEGRSGNYAMFDMLAALDWVQRNIQAFGGNAENVTVFGESAGATAVGNLIASPLSEGLFRRAILQSGGWMGLGLGQQTPLASAEQQGQAQAEDFGAASISELREASTREILAHFPTGGSILVDGHFLPEDASLIFEKGAQQKVDVLAGSNRDESVFFGPGPETAATFRSTVEAQYGPLTNDFLSHYPADSDETANASHHHSFSDALAFHMRKLAAYMAAENRNAYVYFFTRVPPGQEDRGATHVAELPYVFNHQEQHPEWTETDRRLAERISTYWINFATTGDPNRVGLTTWPVYTGHEPGKVLVLGDEVRGEREMTPEASELEFFERAYERILQQLRPEN